MAKFMCYNAILQGDDATEEFANEYLHNFDFSECEIEEENIRCYAYQDTYNGVSMYYDYGADYYFFVKEKGWNHYDPQQRLRALGRSWDWKPCEGYEEGIYTDGDYNEYTLDEYGHLRLIEID